MDWELILLFAVLGLFLGVLSWIIGYLLSAIRRFAAWLPIVVGVMSSLTFAVGVAGSSMSLGASGSVLLLFTILMIPVFVGCAVAWKYPQPGKWSYREGVCNKCGYSLAGLDGGVCPECGGEV